MIARYKLTLFVTPDCSGKALAHLYTALEDLAYNDYELRMVDVIDHPDQAKAANVLGTPALVYHGPAGDVMLQRVSDLKAVRAALGIDL